MKKNKICIWGLATIFICIPIGLYALNFGIGFWKDPNDWGSMGSYLGGIYSPIFSFGTLFILWSQFQRQKEIERESIKLDIARRRFDFSVNILERLKTLENEIESNFENYDELDSSSKEPIEKIYDIYYDWACDHTIVIRKPGCNKIPTSLAGKDKVRSSFELYISCLEQLKISSDNTEIAEIYRQAKLVGHTFYYSQILKEVDVKKEHFN